MSAPGVTESWVVVFECARGTRTLAAKLGQEHGTLYTTNVHERVACWPTAAAAEAWLAPLGGFGRGETMHCGGAGIRAFAVALTPGELADLRLDGAPFHGPLPPGIDYYHPAVVGVPFEPTERATTPPPPAKAARPKHEPEPDWPGHVWREVPAEERIRYCPGSSIGLPRWGSRRLVDRWTAADERYLEVTRPYTAEPGPRPHEGLCSPCCPRWSPTPRPDPVHRFEPAPADEPTPPPRRPSWVDRPRAVRAPSIAAVRTTQRGLFDEEEALCTAQ